MNVNPYEAPSAEFNAPMPAHELRANLEAALAGDYDFTIAEVMNEAWRMVRGMKGAFWGAAVVLGLLRLIADTVCSAILGMFLTQPVGLGVQVLTNTFIGALLTPLTMGLQMMCVPRALDATTSFSTAFSYLSRSGPVLAGALLGLLLGYLGSIALVLPGIYLFVGYSLTTQLVCDQDMGAWEAMETSRRAITRKWWRVLGLGLLVTLIVLVSALGLLIPLIWTIPWAMMTTAVLYKRIFFAPVPVPAAGPAGPPASAPA